MNVHVEVIYSACFIDVLCVQLVEKENVRAVLSYNEEFELNYFTNTKKVSCIYYNNNNNNTIM